ncbi:hypothetical protein DY000_02048492 [Brassica cretica]|uniref:Uncharacterized protein n=1 Tax=Brassica cretica TaxID=69181 RepID=A0ABQ7F539_BRACR|nr:hypothetical protein DY000_02048492 [Brassica cretica]
MELRRRPFDVRCFWSPHSLRSSAEKLNRESPNKVDSSSLMSLHELLNFTDQTCMYNFCCVSLLKKSEEEMIDQTSYEDSIISSDD